MVEAARHVLLASMLGLLVAGAAGAEVYTDDTAGAGLSYVQDPLGKPQIPNWNRVISALPGFLDELRDAVEADAHDLP